MFDMPDPVTLAYKANYVVIDCIDSGSEYFFLNLN